MRAMAAACLALGCAASTFSEAPLSWRLLEAPALASRVQVTQAGRVVGDYALECMVGDEAEDEESDLAVYRVSVTVAWQGGREPRSVSLASLRVALAE